jgi:two-component system nitrate/nitrite sensor histidine kinase NarX
LRIWPAEQGLSGWLEQTVEEFRELTGLPVIIEILDVKNDLPPEVHAQLIRIVQEALSNVRKHSQAGQVWIACREDENDLILEIRDNGRGFTPEYASNPSRHGLRGMRERADLIGADYQITSQPNEGTQICLRLPLKGLRMKEVS